jgi:hypothetical protein
MSPRARRRAPGSSLSWASTMLSDQSIAIRGPLARPASPGPNQSTAWGGVRPRPVSPSPMPAGPVSADRSPSGRRRSIALRVVRLDHPGRRDHRVARLEPRDADALRAPPVPADRGRGDPDQLPIREMTTTSSESLTANAATGVPFLPLSLRSIRPLPPRLWDRWLPSSLVTRYSSTAVRLPYPLSVMVSRSGIFPSSPGRLIVGPSQSDSSSPAGPSGRSRRRRSRRRRRARCP